MLCFIGMTITQLFGTLLTANGNLNLLNKIAFGAAILNIVLNYALIPSYTVIGAAYASLITQSLVAIAQVIICYRLFALKFSLQTTLKFILFIGLIITATYSYYLTNYNWKLYLLILPILSILLILGLKIVNRNQVKELFSSTSKVSN